MVRAYAAAGLCQDLPRQLARRMTVARREPAAYDIKPSEVAHGVISRARCATAHRAASEQKPGNTE